MSSKAGFRIFAQSLRQTQSAASRQSQNAFRQTIKRHQTTASNPAVEAEAKSMFRRLWESEVGIKTVHFCLYTDLDRAPVMKWGVVLAGVSDFFRPAEKLSLTQNLAIIATGAIWTRWCFIIRPKNIFLASVNFALFCVGAVQCTRIFMVRASETGSKEEAVKELATELKDTAKSAEKKVEAKL